jgi:hypothetical protein
MLTNKENKNFKLIFLKYSFLFIFFRCRFLLSGRNFGRNSGRDGFVPSLVRALSCRASLHYVDLGDGEVEPLADDEGLLHSAGVSAVAADDAKAFIDGEAPDAAAVASLRAAGDLLASHQHAVFVARRGDAFFSVFFFFQWWRLLRIVKPVPQLKQCGASLSGTQTWSRASEGQDCLPPMKIFFDFFEQTLFL